MVTALRRSFVPRHGWRRALLILTALLIPQSVCGTSRAAIPVGGLHVRVTWGGGARVVWQGKIAVSEGSLQHIRSLGLDEDVPGSFVAQGSVIPIVSQSAHAFDAVNLWIDAPLTADLMIDLTSQGGNNSDTTLIVPLADLLRQPAVQLLDDTGNSVHVQRAPGDALRVSWNKDHLVFSPRDVWSLRVVPAYLGLPDGTSIDLHATLSAKGSDEILWREDEPLVVRGDGVEPSGVNWDITMPAEEGVYDLLLSVHSRSPRKFWKDGIVLQRRVQSVVFDGTHAPSQAVAEIGWQEIISFDPTQSRWWERLAAQTPTLPHLRGVPPRILGDRPPEFVPWENGRYSRIRPGGWQALPLPIKRPDRPHVIDVSYPRGYAQVLGAAILESRPFANIAQLNPEACVEVESDFGTTRGEENLQLVIWPRTTQPYLMLTNRHASRDAIFGRIRVRESLGPLPGLMHESGTMPARRVELAASDTQSSHPFPGRNAWAYFDRPVFPATFSARQESDPKNGRPADDWETFQVGTARLIEYLNYVGFNGMALSVWSEGASLYPQATLDPTPKYDTGVYFTTGQDPVQKDVLELMFRAFDREGIMLVPTLQFSGPLPELERLRRTDPAGSEGIALINAAGQPYESSRPATRPELVTYNPLDERVQGQIVSIVSHLSKRYGHHPSFAGVNIELSDGYCTQLPDASWGTDRITVQRFLREQTSGANFAGQLQAIDPSGVLVEPQRSAWIRWRADTLSSLYRKLAEHIQAARPTARLYLSPIGLTSVSALRPALGPALPPPSTVNQALLEMGLDFEQLNRESAIAVLRTEVNAKLDPLVIRGPQLEWNNNTVLDELGRQPNDRISLFYQVPAPKQFPGFDAQQPFGEQSSVTWLVPQVTPAGDANRMRLIHSLVTRDTTTFMDGGWTMTRGQPDTLRDLLDVYRRLPIAKFDTVAKPEGTSSPLTVRKFSDKGRTYIYLVNDSPWPAKADLRLADTDATRIRSISPHIGIGDLRQDGTATLWQPAVEGYGLLAAVIEQANVAPQISSVNYSEEVTVLLRRRLTAISERVARLADPRPMSILANPGFEAGADTQVALGWDAATGPGIRTKCDSTVAHSGTHALQVESDGPVAWVRSAPFDPPRTGRLALNVWLRGSGSGPSPPLRIAIEGKLEGKTYYRHSPIERETGDSAITTEWAPFVLRVDDLPTTGLTDVRIGFDLMGPGTVWIDDVEIHDLSFTKGERHELTKAIAVAEWQLSNGQVAECWQTIQRYWPRFLETYVPVDPSFTAASASRSGTPATSPQGKPRAGKMLDRVRRAISPLRR